jgi:L-ascorbate metabolism protein UlaG (beta-lactamase superfamily)
MKAAVTYVYHNCFVLELGGRTLVFDYPSAEHRNDEAEAVVRKALEGSDAYVFFSHSHPDHCSPEILGLAADAASVNYVLSYDVPDMVPELDLEDATTVEPEGEEYPVGDLTISGMESTDLGVAFLIRSREAFVYFGGDLAEWTWEGLKDIALDRERAYYEECIKDIAAFGPDIAFANLDVRLPNLGGGPQLVRDVGPKVFVPMHGFGKTDLLAGAAKKIEAPGTEIFIYRETGDRFEVEL